ncbi:MAG TPA: DNA repair protein RadA, partial [Gammaproteobacteria bacterium]|nr:DNA repair protein RadA [Gammaproteobacteria bacterium]
MAARKKTRYRCQECGGLHSKWNGQCSDCSAWNSLEEEIAAPEVKANPRFSGYAGETKVQSLTDVDLSDNPRTSSGLSELDRVLGGGIVSGSVTLIGGDPGIGKSTLLT